MNELKRIGTIMGVIIGLITIFGAVYKLDCKNIQLEGKEIFAGKKELVIAQTDLKKDYNIKIAAVQNDFVYWKLTQQARDLQQWMWKAEDRYGTVANMPPQIKDQYRKNRSQLEILQRQIKDLENKKR